MITLLIILILLFLFGGGGGYYAYNSHGAEASGVCSGRFLSLG
jgi:hypothetical protein